MATIRRRATKAGEARYDVRYWQPGRGRQQSKTFRRYEDAEAFKRKAELEEVSGLVADHRRGDRPLGPFAERWIETRLTKGRSLRASTVQGYSCLWRRNIAPALGEVPIRRISPEMVRDWYSTVVANAGSDQAAKSYRLLRAVLNTAVDDELLVRNPCRIRGAGIEHAQDRPMPATSAVLDIADVIDPRYRALVLLAGLAGLRTGEMLGLCGADVDGLRRTITISRQVQEVAGRRIWVEAAKTDAGARTITLPSTLVDELVSHMARYSQPRPSGALFTDPEGGLVRRASFYAAFREACRKAGALEGLHVHDLRHHAATVIARMPGITTKELMVRLGHKSPRAALIYQHATRERDRAIAEYLEAQLGSVDRTVGAAVVDLPLDHTPRRARNKSSEPGASNG